VLRQGPSTRLVVPLRQIRSLMDRGRQGKARTQSGSAWRRGNPHEGCCDQARTKKIPVVLAIRDMNPTQPAELMFAVQSLFDIGRTDEAKFFLIQLMEAQPDQQLLSQFHKKYGEALFFRLSKDQRMAPEGAEFAQAVQRSSTPFGSRSAARSEAGQELSSPSSVTRHRAIDSLSRLDTSVVTPLLEALTDRSRSDEHPRSGRQSPASASTWLTLCWALSMRQISICRFKSFGHWASSATLGS
jgi:hypothetical protein